MLLVCGGADDVTVEDSLASVVVLNVTPADVVSVDGEAETIVGNL